MTGYRKREIGGLVRRALTTMPVVAVTGLRQAGKSTFLQNEPGLAGREFLSLDEFGVLEAARAAPRRQPDA
jgi:predicted AAA+ superfamily ATPase